MQHTEESHTDDNNCQDSLTDKLLACFETGDIPDHQLEVLLNDIINRPTSSEAREPITNTWAKHNVGTIPSSLTCLGQDRYLVPKHEKAANGKHTRSISDMSSAVRYPSSKKIGKDVPRITNGSESLIPKRKASKQNKTKEADHSQTMAKPPSHGCEESTLDTRPGVHEKTRNESFKVPALATATSNTESIMASLTGNEDDLLSSLGLSFDEGTTLIKVPHKKESAPSIQSASHLNTPRPDEEYEVEYLIKEPHNNDSVPSIQSASHLNTLRPDEGYEVEYEPILPARYEACQVLQKYIENGYSFPDDDALTETAAEEPTDTDCRSDSQEKGECHSKPLLMTAEATDEGSGLCGQPRKLYLLVTLFGFLIAGLVVSIPCGIIRGCSEDAQSNAVTLDLNETQAQSSPPISQTSAPTGSLVKGLPTYTLDALEYPASPQSQAYSWLRDDPNLPTYSNAKRIQRFALATLYYSTGSSEWKNNSGWLDYDHDECTWFSKADPKGYASYNGFPCNQKLQYTHITLYDNGLSGSIPPEVGLLTSLQILDLSINAIHGSIPTEVGILRNLRELWFYDNSLSGPVPTQFGSLTNLVHLLVHHNNLSYSLPSELGMLSALTKLELDNNFLNSTIPSEFGMLTSIRSVILSRNMLEGSIPTEIGLLSHLMALDLSVNRLTSTLPTQLGYIRSLEQLLLHENNLEGNAEDLSFASSLLMVLSLEENDLLTGTMPTSLCHLDSLGFTCTNELCGCWCDCSRYATNSTT